MKNVSRIVTWLFLFFLPTQLGKHFFFDFSYISGVRIDYLSVVLYLTDILFILALFLNWNNVVTSLKKSSSLIISFIFLVLGHLILVKAPLLELYAAMKIFQIFLAFIVFKSIKIPEISMLSALVSGTALQVILALMQFTQKSAIQGPFYLLGERFLSIATPGVAKASILGEFILRPYGTFSHPNSLGGFYALLFVYLLTLKTQSERASYLRFVGIMLSTLLVLISFSKGAILAAALAFIAYILMNHRDALSCRFCTGAKVFIGFVVLSFFLSSQGDSESISKRLLLIEESFMIIQQNELLGTGFGHHLFAHAKFPTQYSFFFLQPVHNIFMLFIMQAGIVFSGMLGWSVFQSLKNNWKKAGQYLILPLIVIGITGSVDHYWLTLQQNMLLFGVVFGKIAQRYFED